MSDSNVPEACQSTGECKYAMQAADIAVTKVFAILGVDIDDPKQVSNFQEDLRFSKSFRILAGKTGTRMTFVLMTALFSGCLALIWKGIKG